MINSSLVITRPTLVVDRQVLRTSDCSSAAVDIMSDSNDGIDLSPESYLDKNHVLLYLEDSVNQLLEHKEDNPKVNAIKFMSEYIVLLDDALDYLISFTDFLYAFQVQFCYQEFIEKCGEIYSVLYNQRSPRDPVVVPTSGLASIQFVPANSSPPADGVETINLLRAIVHLCETSKISAPPIHILHEILTSTTAVRISLYEFLMALAKSEAINTSLASLPSKAKVFDSIELCSPLSKEESSSLS